MSPEEQRAQRDQVVQSAMFAVDRVLLQTPTYRVLPHAQQSRIIVEAAIGYLLGKGLITVAPDEQWPQWLDLDIPEHLVPDVAGEVKRWAAVEQSYRASNES